jgi:hypothetical protein
MSDLAFAAVCAIGLLGFLSCLVLIAALVCAKDADSDVREFMAERERQSDPLERMWDLPSRQPVRR